MEQDATGQSKSRIFILALTEMSKLHVCELSEVMPSFPEVRKLTPSDISDLERADLFLCALGFEDRCLTIPGALSNSGFKASKAYYIEYSTIPHENATNRPQLLEHLNGISANIQSINGDDVGYAKALRELISPSEESGVGVRPTVVFDISVASNKLLMRCMDVFFASRINLIILYSEAAVYHPTKEEFEHLKKTPLTDGVGLEAGVSEVSICEEYAGFHVDQLPDCLLIFPSFNRERALAVVSAVDPSIVGNTMERVVWLLGLPHLPEDQWRLDMMVEIMQIPKDSSQYKVFNVSTFDYRESVTLLNRLYEERSLSSKLTLSPMGSKLQALGAALFCYMRPDVRVIFATPKEYNTSAFSKGCKDTWIINFGDLDRLKAQLDQVGQIRLEE